MRTENLLRTVGTMLTRKHASKKTDKDWFYFSSALATTLVSDYISLRFLYKNEPHTTAFTILGRVLDVAEKALKLFVMVSGKSPTALSSARSDYGHNIEKLRSEAAKYDPVFDESTIKTFTRDLNDKSGKLYQHVRYGSEDTIDGLQADLNLLIPVVDRIFFQSILKLPASDRKLLFFVSPLKHLIQGSRFDQTQNRAAVLNALHFQNTEITAFENFCKQMDDEQEALHQKFKGILPAP